MVFVFSLAVPQGAGGSWSPESHLWGRTHLSLSYQPHFSRYSEFMAWKIKQGSRKTINCMNSLWNIYLWSGVSRPWTSTSGSFHCFYYYFECYWNMLVQKKKNGTIDCIPEQQAARLIAVFSLAGGLFGSVLDAIAGSVLFQVLLAAAQQCLIFTVCSFLSGNRWEHLWLTKMVRLFKSVTHCRPILALLQY